MTKTVGLMCAVSALCAAATATAQQLPPAQCGECYARVLVPAQYTTETVTLVSEEESEKLEVIPPEFEWVEEEIMVAPAYTKYMVKQAQYGTETMQVVDKPAHMVWKKGRGPYQTIDNATGEIVCRVPVPASYKSLEKKVVRNDPSIREQAIAAQYKKIRVRKLKTPARVKRTTIPAKYASYNKRIKIADARVEWQPVLCETNSTPATIWKIQAALKREGYLKHKPNGKLGRTSMEALRQFQADNDLPQGHVTMQTLSKLGIDPPCQSEKSLVRVRDDKIELLEKVYFDTAKASIKARSFAVLDQVAQVMAKRPNMHVKVEGHTDNQGDAGFNQDLSQRRAEAVRRYLIAEKGIASSRLQAKGHGANQPIASNETNSGRSQNRRVEFMIAQ